MNGTLLIGSLWVVSLALTFWAGSALSTSEAPPVPAQDPVPSDDTKEPKGDGGGHSAGRTPSPRKPTNEGDSRPKSGSTREEEPEVEFPPNLRRAMEGGGIVERLGAYLDAVRSMDSGNAQLVTAAFEALPKGYGRHLEMKLLMRSWAAFDPQSALAYANDKLDAKSERRFAVAEALAEWAARNPQQAFQWAKENHDGKSQDNPLLAGVIKGIAEKDLEEASQMFFELPEGNARWQASHHLINKLGERGPDSLIAWANKIPQDEGALRGSLLGQIGSAIAKQDPARAAKWAATQELGDATQRVVNTVLSHWISKDASSAAEWSATIENPSDRRFAMTQIANYWGVRDPVAAAEWLNRFPASRDMDPVVGAFVSRISGRDPQGAVNWALSIVDQTSKDAALRQALTAWRRVDKTAAEQWRSTNAPHLQ